MPDPRLEMETLRPIIVWHAAKCALVVLLLCCVQTCSYMRCTCLLFVLFFCDLLNCCSMLFTCSPSLVRQFPGGVGTNGVVAEVPLFPTISLHGKMWAKCGNIFIWGFDYNFRNLEYVQTNNVHIQTTNTCMCEMNE